MMKRVAVLGAAIVAAVSLSGVASAASGANSVTIRQTNPNRNATVVSVGVINATGRDVVLSDTEDKFVYPEGNIFVTHTPTSSKSHQDDCVFKNEEEGTYRVTGGTGDYKGAEGRGTYEANLTVKGCNPNKPPKSFLLVVHASGTLDIDNNG